jgi:hypothetical protein
MHCHFDEVCRVREYGDSLLSRNDFNVFTCKLNVSHGTAPAASEVLFRNLQTFCLVKSRDTIGLALQFFFEIEK